MMKPTYIFTVVVTGPEHRNPARSVQSVTHAIREEVIAFAEKHSNDDVDIHITHSMRVREE